MAAPPEADLAPCSVAAVARPPPPDSPGCDEEASGGPWYPRRRYEFGGRVAALVDAYDTLPPLDAVGLLDGVDETGQMVWDGSLLLSRWVVAAPCRMRLDAVASAAIVELGCGAGLLSAVCAQLAPSAAVVATDINPQCVEMAATNAALSGAANVASEVYDWGDDAPPSGVQSACAGAGSVCVVAGDVIYDASAPPLLLHAWDTIAAATPLPATLTLLLAFLPRNWTDANNASNWEAVVAGVAARGWRIAELAAIRGRDAQGYVATIHVR